MNSTSKALVGVLALLISSHSQTARADNYVLDPSHTSIIFGINHLGYSFTYGRFNKAEGKFVWNNANPASGQFQFAISTASIDTNDAKRDEHLRGPDFFNAMQFPTISFQSSGITPRPNSPNKFQVHGNLTIHGVTRQVALPLQKLGEGNGPYGKYRCGFLCQTSVKRSDYGMATMIPNIGDKVALTICFEGTRQGAASASGSAPAPRGSSGAKQGSSGKKGSATQGGSAKKQGSATQGGSAKKQGSATQRGSSKQGSGSGGR